MTSKKPAAEAVAAPRTAAQIAEDLAAQRTETALAEREVVALQAARPDMLLTVPDEALEAHDIAIARAGRRMERAGAMIQKLIADHAAAEAAEEQARRQALHAEGLAAAVEFERLHIEEYARAAAAVAEILRKLPALVAVIDRANANLPEHVVPIDAEVFRAKGATPDRYEPHVERYEVDADGKEIKPAAQKAYATRLMPAPVPSHAWEPNGMGGYRLKSTEPAPQRKYRRRTVMSYIRGDRGTRPRSSLLDSVLLPALRAGEPDFWGAR